MKKKVGTNMTTLTITRKKVSLLMVPAKIILDGELKQKLKNGERANFELTSGKHTLQIQTTFGMKSETKEIEIFERTVTQVEISKSPRYMKYYWSHIFPLLIISFVIMGIGSSMGNTLIAALGVIGLVVSYVFVIKANKVLFDIEQV